MSSEEGDEARTMPMPLKAQSSQQFEFANDESRVVDLKFAKSLDEEGYKELIMFLQAPSSVVLQSILEYQPTASFGFVKNHVFDGLSDDENPEFDADYDDHTSQIFPSRAAQTVDFTGAAAGTAAVVAAAAPRPASTRSVRKDELDPSRAAMPAAVAHFTPDWEAEKEMKKMSYEKPEAPIAVRHFTPDWETELPASVRDSLNHMSPEERAKWVSRPIAVQHFTPKHDAPSKANVEYTAYEMPIAMKHFAPEPKEKKEYVPEPMPAAVAHFTPDWDAEKEKKRLANQVKEPAPIAVQHFTPKWEVFIPPTVRESLARMSPEQRKKWVQTPIAVSHFTPYQPPKAAAELEPKEVPIAVRHFTPDPSAAKVSQKVELEWESMPVATRHFTPDPNVKKAEHVPEPMPAATKHFTPDWRAEREAAEKAKL